MKGLEESVIAIIMKEVAKALEYVHRSGGIHRDVKVGRRGSGDGQEWQECDVGWQYID